MQLVMRSGQITVYTCAARDHLLCSLLYCLCAVRGYKRVVRCFPHEAHDLLSCLEVLEMAVFAEDDEDEAAGNTGDAQRKPNPGDAGGTQQKAGSAVPWSTVAVQPALQWNSRVL